MPFAFQFALPLTAPSSTILRLQRLPVSRSHTPRAKAASPQPRHLPVAAAAAIPRRTFLALTAALTASPALPRPTTAAAAIAAPPPPAFELPPLPYAYDALEPKISSQIMHAHHDAHFATYVTNLNAALASLPPSPSSPTPVTDAQLIKLLASLDTAVADPALRTKLRNNGGGYLNHKQFFSTMSPAPPALAPTSPLLSALETAFAGFDAFEALFLGKATTLFGSGFTWLVLTKDNKLDIMQTPNQDNPVIFGAVPLLACDCWEHAWYYQYGPKKKDYLAAWWTLIDWPLVNDAFVAASRKA